jgi:nucleoside-diphosphate-sugar epimerase
MPGVSATVGEMISSLEKVAGPDCVKLIERRRDATIQRIVEGWAQRVNASRAQQLGFSAETSFEEIIRHHVEDEMS